MSVVGCSPYRLVITTGEPAGIGPDICLQLIAKGHVKRLAALSVQLIFVVDPELLMQRARELDISVKIVFFDSNYDFSIEGNSFIVAPVPLLVPCVKGVVNPDNSSSVLKMLDYAVEGCVSGMFDAMVTAPIHKAVINDVFSGFYGHTGYLAESVNVKNPVMMMVSDCLRVALVTTHVPLFLVNQMLTQELICRVIRILRMDLESYFGCVNPLIEVCGLNPHAGEGGVLGCEETEIIIPALRKMSNENIKLSGPVSADTAFIRKRKREIPDVILAMYHDQGLPAFKALSFGRSANVTLGLDIIRTSVDHGTALELAGSGQACEDSLVAAVEFALGMCMQKRKNRNSSLSGDY